MGRRRRRDPGRLGKLYRLLLTAPVWMGPVLAAMTFASLGWLLPWLLDADDPAEAAVDLLSTMLSGVSAGVAPWIAGLILLMWAVAETRKWLDRWRLDRQTGLSTIAKLDWVEFEALLAEAFRRQGFRVEVRSGAGGPDGGIDLRLDKAGAETLVQCKHWRKAQVGVRVVRELLGVVTSEGAISGIVVTSGRFTSAAVEFAGRNPIRLIAGRELAKMIRQVQRGKKSAARRE